MGCFGWQLTEFLQIHSKQTYNGYMRECNNPLLYGTANCCTIKKRVITTAPKNLLELTLQCQKRQNP